MIGLNPVSIVRQSNHLSKAFDYDLKAIMKGNAVAAFLLTFFVFLMICMRAKIIHGFANGGILPSHQHHEFNPFELWAYRFLKIKLIVWTYGADVRTRKITKNLGKFNCCSDCDAIEMACICRQEKADANLARINKSAIAIFSMGDMIEYVPGSINDLFFWPIDIDDDGGRKYAPAYPDADHRRTFKIIHAPNHPQFKGTAYLKSATDRLKDKGWAIELILVQGIANDDALKIYRNADIIFDQCLIGFHGYFALEAMALGKPVMCFVRKPKQYLIDPKNCPMINTSVQSLEHDLENLLENRDALQKTGRQSRKYIEAHHCVEAFARRLELKYRQLGILA